jgi:hypothetical protein
MNTTPADTVPLRYGLRAHYITHAQIAAQQRTQGRKTAQRNDQQLALEAMQQ